MPICATTFSVSMPVSSGGFVQVLAADLVEQGQQSQA
jgi:hypothetical protein